MDVRFETKNGNKAGKHEWLTPPEIIKTLGPFDLDPCYSEPRPWPTASRHYGETDNGLILPWSGFVWCNPPYGEYAEKWLQKCADYKNVIALIFARTETKMFHEYIWNKAFAVFFFKGRLAFYNADGSVSKNSAGAPSCLVAWNETGYARLQKMERGKLILL